MVIKGSTRGEPQKLAKHLLSSENESATVIEIRGVVSDNLCNALVEMTTLSAGTRTRSRRSLYHASISVEAGEATKLTGNHWIEAMDTLEEKLGLNGHPRVVVQHRKNDASGFSREHYHVVWSRTNPSTLKVVSDSNNYKNHELVSRELESRWNLRYVVGVHTRKPGTPRPVAKATHKDVQASTRTAIRIADVAGALKQSWGASRDGKSFIAAIQPQGLTLARGRRGIVIVDSSGTPHSIPRRLQLKAYVVDRRLADIDVNKLPTVETVQRLRKQQILGANMNKVGTIGDTSRKAKKVFPWDNYEAYWTAIKLKSIKYPNCIIIDVSECTKIYDFGNRLELHTSGEPTDAEIKLLVEAAKARGWTEIRFFGGSKSFQERARQEALRQGWPLEKISLECEDHLKSPATESNQSIPAHMRKSLSPCEGEQPTAPPPSQSQLPIEPSYQEFRP